MVLERLNDLLGSSSQGVKLSEISLSPEENKTYTFNYYADGRLVSVASTESSSIYFRDKAYALPVYLKLHPEAGTPEDFGAIILVDDSDRNVDQALESFSEDPIFKHLDRTVYLLGSPESDTSTDEIAVLAPASVASSTTEPDPKRQKIGQGK